MKIGLAMYSLHRMFQEGTLDPADSPQFCVEKLGIRLLDPTYPLMPLTDAGFRSRFKANADAAGAVISTLAVGREGDLAAVRDDERRKAVRNHQKWFDIAGELGAYAFRANTGGPDKPNSDAVNRCIDSFSQLARMGETTGIKVMIENHGGLSRLPAPICHIIEGVNSEYLGTVPDFGNFADDIRYEALKRVVPYAIAMHAKTKEFKGEQHVSYNLDLCMKICKEAGYRGDVSIEFEGPVGGPDQPADEADGILRSKKLLEACAW